MRVAILGDGLVARSVAEAIADKAEVTVFGHGDLDVTAPVTLAVLDDYDVAVNTVAFHRFDACEADPAQAQRVNTLGARYVAETLPTIYISTDYVFNDDGPHDEVLPGERPRSVYGQTKLGGELETLEAGGIVVRIAAPFGHYQSHKGPTLPERVLHTIGGTLRLPTDQTFTPTYMPDAAQRIVALALYAEGLRHDSRRIYHATNAGSATWAQLGQATLEVAAFKPCKIEGFAAKDPKRPRNSALRSTILPPIRHWRIALEEWAIRDQREREAAAVSPLRATA